MLIILETIHFLNLNSKDLEPKTEEYLNSIKICYLIGDFN